MIWLIAGLALYVCLLFLIAWLSLHPYRIPFYISPGSLGAPQTEIEFESSDGALIRAWWVQNDAARFVAVMAHGYMMNRCELVPEAHMLWRLGASCLLFDFRNHGRSRGSGCSLGVKEASDVRAAVETARRLCPGLKVLLVGSSMGSAASAFAVGENPGLADALVLDSVYGRLSRAILGWWRFLGGRPLSLLLSPMPLICWPLTRIDPFRVDVARSVAAINCPILFFHGTRDNLALPSDTERVFAAVSGPKEIVWFEGCGHSEGRWLQSDRYRSALVAFLDSSGLTAEVSASDLPVRTGAAARGCAERTSTPD